LVVNVIGNCPEDVQASIRDLVSSRFVIPVEAITILRSGPSSFILGLPDDETATRVYNGGRPILGQAVRLHVMRWSRLFQSTVSSLPSAIVVELQGIPAHAWELATTEHLLNDYCWIGGSNPDNANQREVFRAEDEEFSAATLSLLCFYVAVGLLALFFLDNGKSTQL